MSVETTDSHDAKKGFLDRKGRKWSAHAIAQGVLLMLVAVFWAGGVLTEAVAQAVLLASTGNFGVFCTGNFGEHGAKAYADARSGSQRDAATEEPRE